MRIAYVVVVCAGVFCVVWVMFGMGDRSVGFFSQFFALSALKIALLRETILFVKKIA